jgi:two-component system osmolarity sensor histidine kinase EnvZ
MLPFLEDVVAAARRASVHIRALVVEPGLRAHMRPDAMRRALGNLFDNARRHDASVVLSARRVGGGVSILVDDDGPGIPPDRRAQVLRAFESGQDGGTGLGLTIARDIIRAHGGDMALEQAPEGGLRVRLYLPN